MAEPRLEPPARPSAQRLSEDIGDVLSAIRRLIADNEQGGDDRHPLSNHETPSWDAQSQHGAAFSFDANDDDDPCWPLGPLANSPGAPRPKAVWSNPTPEDLGASEWAADDDGALASGAAHDGALASGAASEANAAEPSQQALAVQTDDEDAFVEAFDWKARTRPDPCPTAMPTRVAPAPDGDAESIVAAQGDLAPQQDLLCSLPWLDVSRAPQCPQDTETFDQRAEPDAAQEIRDRADVGELSHLLRAIIREELERAFKGDRALCGDKVILSQ